jgi:hypothetical protein
MAWNLEGLRIEATYLDEFPVVGRVSLSRVAYGGSVNHHVQLDNSMMIYGNNRDTVIVEHSSVTRVMQ